jgi:hypothetical protein
MKKQINILDENGNKLKIAPLLKLIGYEVNTPAYIASLVFDKCGFSQEEIIKLITTHYPR